MRSSGRVSKSENRVSLRPSFTSLHGEQSQHRRGHVVVMEVLSAPNTSFLAWQQFFRVEDEEGSPRKVAHNRRGVNIVARDSLVGLTQTHTDIDVVLAEEVIRVVSSR